MCDEYIYNNLMVMMLGHVTEVLGHMGKSSSHEDITSTGNERHDNLAITRCLAFPAECFETLSLC